MDMQVASATESPAFCVECKDQEVSFLVFWLTWKETANCFGIAFWNRVYTSSSFGELVAMMVSGNNRQAFPERSGILNQGL